jgi:hypothetical protein
LGLLYACVRFVDRRRKRACIGSAALGALHHFLERERHLS